MRPCIVSVALVTGAGVCALAFGQFDDAFQLGEEINTAEQERRISQQSEHVAESASAPALPPQMPLNVALQERLTLLQDQLQVTRNKKAAALRQGKTGQEIEALDVKIAQLGQQLAAVQSELSPPSAPPAQAAPPAPRSPVHAPSAP